MFARKVIMSANHECMPMAAVSAPKFSAFTYARKVKKPAKSSMVLAFTGLLGAHLKAPNSFTVTPLACTRR